MRRFLFLLLLIALVIPGFLRSETVYLKDGSVFTGTLIDLKDDTLSFKLSFGSVINVPKSSVKRIEFVDAPSATVEDIASEETSSTKPGTLFVAFEKFDVTSRIVMKRTGDRESYERENSIEQSLMVANKKMYSVTDSTTNKVIKKGSETVLRNDMKPVDFKIVLPPGLHQCALSFRNSRAAEYEERFDPRPLDRTLGIENVQIEPGETFVVRVGMKRKKWGLTKTVLYRVN